MAYFFSNLCVPGSVFFPASCFAVVDSVVLFHCFLCLLSQRPPGASINNNVDEEFAYIFFKNEIATYRIGTSSDNDAISSLSFLSGNLLTDYKKSLIFPTQTIACICQRISLHYSKVQFKLIMLRQYARTLE